MERRAIPAFENLSESPPAAQHTKEHFILSRSVKRLFAAAVLAAASASPSWGQSTYTVTDLGPGVATGINNNGQVVGYSNQSNGYPYAFLYSNGSMQLISGQNSYAYGINNNGQVVGAFYPQATETAAAFVYSSGSTQFLGTLPGYSGGTPFSVANGINDSGQIVGFSGAGGNGSAFLYSGGSMQNLFPGSVDSSATAINNHGEIVGGRGTSAFIDNNGTMQFFAGYAADGLNNNGQVIGFTVPPPGVTTQTSFLYSAGTMQTLSPLPGFATDIAQGINNSGQVVGYDVGPYQPIGSVPHHAFLYSNGSMQDLNSLISPSSGWTLQFAEAINDGGQIVGYGINPSGQTDAFLLTPTTSVSWARPVPGNWSTASSWTPANVPTSTINASFNTGSTTPYNVTLTGASAANNLTVQGDSVTLNLGGNQLALAGTLIVAESGSQPGSLTLAATTGGSIAAPRGVSVGQATDAKPTSAPQYNSLGVVQGATLTGNVTTNPSGQLLGNGTIVGNVVNAGLVTPGTSTVPGQLLIGGNYSQSASGALNIRVNGASASGSFDSLGVTGNASLNGSLNVTTPGSSTSPGSLPYMDTFNIVSSGASTSGTFSNAPAVVQTSFAGDGTTSGVFDVKYNTSTGVTLANFHQIDVLSVGLNDYSTALKPPGYTITGQPAAGLVKQAFSTIPGVVSNQFLPLNSNDAGNSTNNLQLLETKISNVHVNPGDTFVFYINTHGTFGRNPNEPYDEAPTPREQFNSQQQQITVTSNSETELYLSAIDPAEDLTARQFANLFQGQKWANVNKLFILDTCYAGGFWSAVSSNGGTNPYLSGVLHSAVIAASPENLVSWGTIGQGGNLGSEVVAALKSLPNTELSFNDLVTDIQESAVVFPYDNSELQSDPSDGWGINFPPQTDNNFTASTTDFTLGIAGPTAVPEPSTVVLAVVGCVALSMFRRRRRLSAPITDDLRR